MSSIVTMHGYPSSQGKLPNPALVNGTPITYIPTFTSNTQNLNSFVTDPNGDVWFIDNNGVSVKIGSIYSPYINIIDITYVPTPTGNTSNLNVIVKDPDTNVWFIDHNGRAILLYDKPDLTVLDAFGTYVGLMHE